MTDVRLPRGVALVPEAPCPYCGGPLSATADRKKTGRPPRPGDLTICAHCFGLCAFTSAMGLRRVGDDEIAAEDDATRREALETAQHLARHLQRQQQQRRH